MLVDQTSEVPSPLFERFNGLLPSAEPSCLFLSTLSSLSALSSRVVLRQLVGLSDRSLPDGGPCICALTCIHDVVPVIDGQNLLPIQPYLDECLVLLRKPEPINFLVLPYEVSALDPEGQFLRGMAFDPHHRIVVCINPEFSLKQVFVLPLGPSLGNEA